MGTLRACLVAVLAVAATGCGFHGKRADWKDSLPPEQPAPLLSDGSTRVEYEELFEYRLGNEDLIFVDVYGHPEFSGTSNVDDRGNISVKSSGEIVQVGGLTLDACRRVFSERFQLRDEQPIPGTTRTLLFWRR